MAAVADVEISDIRHGIHVNIAMKYYLKVIDASVDFNYNVDIASKYFATNPDDNRQVVVYDKNNEQYYMNFTPLSIDSRDHFKSNKFISISDYFKVYHPDGEIHPATIMVTHPNNDETDPEHVVDDPEHAVDDPEHATGDPEHAASDPEQPTIPDGPIIHLVPQVYFIAEDLTLEYSGSLEAISTAFLHNPEDRRQVILYSNGEYYMNFVHFSNVPEDNFQSHIFYPISGKYKIKHPDGSIQEATVFIVHMDPPGGKRKSKRRKKSKKCKRKPSKRRKIKLSKQRKNSRSRSRRKQQ